MDPHPRLEHLENWVQRIRDGHFAALWLTREFPEGDVGWLSAPIVVWRPESVLAKFTNHLRPIPVACSFQTGVYPAGFSASRICRTGSETWRERFAVTTPMSHRQMRSRLRQMVTDGEQARCEVIEWSGPHREKHTMKASAGISTRKGVTEGFLFDQADIRHVADELIEVVLDQFDRYAGIRRTDRHGKDLLGRPGVPQLIDGVWKTTQPYDLEHQIKEYLRSRARRGFARLLGCSEKELSSSSKLDPSWTPVARSCEYINDVDVESVLELPANDTRSAPKPHLVERAKKAFQTLESNGGVNAVAARLLADPKSTPRRVARALRCPWNGLEEGFDSTVRYLAGRSPDQARQDWCDALHWWVSSDEPAPLLRAPDVAPVDAGPRTAAMAVEVIAAAGGVHQVVGQVLSGRSMRLRTLDALRCPWPGLDDHGFITMISHLSSQPGDVAEQCWQESLTWAVTAGEVLLSLGPAEAMVDPSVVFAGLLPEGQMSLIAA